MSCSTPYRTSKISNSAKLKVTADNKLDAAQVMEFVSGSQIG